MRILTPNLLRGKVSSRSPMGLFEVISDTGKMMEKVYKLFRAWYRLWNTIYLPQILKRQKWHSSSEEFVMEDDIVLFKKTESELSTEWVLGKVEQVRESRDGLVRECVILYKSTGETDRMITVERPSREVVKLFNVEDSGLFEDMDNARKMSKEILQENFESAAIVGTMNVNVKDVTVCCVDHKRTIFKEIKLNQTIKVQDEYPLQMEMMNQSITTDPGEMQGNTVLWGEGPQNYEMQLGIQGYFDQYCGSDISIQIEENEAAWFGLVPQKFAADDNIIFV